MKTNQQYKKLVDLLSKNKRPLKGFHLDTYLGTKHSLYNVAVPTMRQIGIDWTRENKMTESDLIDLVDLLYHGPSREEKVLASIILGRRADILVELSFKQLDTWLAQLTGWEEVDSLCDEVDIWLRANPSGRLPYLKKWSGEKQIEKRRASLVVLCSSVRHDEDKIYSDLSFELIGRLAHEKDVMITKAISWLLRALLRYHKDEVSMFLSNNKTTLPAIAVRETTKKLVTGKK